MKGDFGLLRIGYAACQRNAKNDQILIVKELLRLQGATRFLHKKNGQQPLSQGCWPEEVTACRMNRPLTHSLELELDGELEDPRVKNGINSAEATRSVGRVDAIKLGVIERVERLEAEFE